MVTAKLRIGIGKILALIGLAIFTLVMMFPLYWTLITSFKDINDVFTIPPKLIPFVDFTPTTDPFWFVFLTRARYTFMNSLIISSVATIMAVALGTLSGYAFSRYPHKRGCGEGSFFFLLLLRMLPPFAATLPLFWYWTKIGLYDTYIGLILIYATFNLPLTAWLMRSFIDAVPKSLEDASLVDGRSLLRTLKEIVLPLSSAGIAATVALCWLFIWNEFLFALKLAGVKVVTYTAYLPQLRLGQRIMWNNLSAIGVLGLIPALAIVIAFRKYIIKVYFRA